MSWETNQIRELKSEKPNTPLSTTDGTERIDHGRVNETLYTDEITNYGSSHETSQYTLNMNPLITKKTVVAVEELRVMRQSIKCLHNDVEGLLAK